MHGWVYAVSDGLVRDLNFCATGEDDVDVLFRAAVAALPPATPLSR